MSIKKNEINALSTGRPGCPGSVQHHDLWAHEPEPGEDETYDLDPHISRPGLILTADTLMPEVVKKIEEWDLTYSIGCIVQKAVYHEFSDHPLSDLKEARWHIERLIAMVEEEEND
ncbi:MAG TPA: hypothetical protein EYN67_04015 [Flavobacteriales bacterium]|jgi:hypothetical protein|nr:hypothetical protein [Flavobacteriales bacterium]